jgi:tRNA pseudouridine38-40 synthase
LACAFRLDLEQLRAAAERLEGRHDFAAFAANRGRPEESTVRTIYRIGVRRSGTLVTLKFEGEGFLYRMVRLLTGSMIRVAQGKESLNWLEDFIRKPKDRRTSYCAPAQGLYLERVLYGHSRTAIGKSSLLIRERERETGDQE